MKTFSDIKSAGSTLFNSRWVIPLAGGATLIMLFLVVLGLSQGMPKLMLIHSAPVGEENVPLAQIEQLVGASFWTGPLEAMSTLPPATPVATTKKVSFTYQGFVETADGLKLAYVKVADRQFIGTNGAPVESEFKIAEFDLKTLTIRNVGRTNVLNFNSPTEIEVPLK